MKTLNKIPTGKIERASNLLKAGAKVGVNYIKYYGNKITKDEEEAKKILNEDNAADIYDSLKELKGSTLKVAQMLSMEKKHHATSLRRKIFAFAVFGSATFWSFG